MKKEEQREGEMLEGWGKETSPEKLLVEFIQQLNINDLNLHFTLNYQTVPLVLTYTTNPQLVTHCYMPLVHIKDLMSIASPMCNICGFAGIALSKGNFIHKHK